MLRTLERWLITFDRRHIVSWSRLALCLIYVWFGLLKVLLLSPAQDLVQALLSKLAPHAPFLPCFIALGLVEVGIGLLFLWNRTQRLALSLLMLHLVLTMLPLILLPDRTWQLTLVPTLEGQYILKNVAILALAAGLGARLRLPSTS